MVGLSPAYPARPALPPKRDPAWRLGVGAVVFNHAGKVLMGQRRDAIAEAWQFPQGGIDSGETPEEALHRELREEIGTDKVEVIANSHTWLRYELPHDLRRRLWRGRYRGQQQQWYLARFLGSDSDIELDSGLGTPEFLAWNWFPLDEAESRIVPFKQEMYREIKALFALPLKESLKGESLKGEPLTSATSATQD